MSCESSPVADNIDMEAITEGTELMSQKWFVQADLMGKTPSILRGMGVTEEMECRRKGVRFIKYMMRYLTFEKIIQGQTLDQTKAPRVFPTAVHFFHRFYTIHPFQVFNEYVTAVACVFHATKVEEHVLSLNRMLELARINARSLSWVKVPAELSFDKSDWAALWKNEVSETEFMVFTTVNPMRFLFVNAYGFIVMFLKKWLRKSVEEDVAVRIRDRAFAIASDVYSCGCTLVVTESSRMVAAMCLMMVLKQMKLTITDWIGKAENQLHWFQLGESTTTLDSLKKMEYTFLAHLKQYNIVKSLEDKNKEKGVSPSSDYGSEGSVISSPKSPAESMCSDREVMSNEATSPAASTASSSDHGVSLRDDGKERLVRPLVAKSTDLAPPCHVSVNYQGRRLDVSTTSGEPDHKRIKTSHSHSPIRWC